MLRKLKDLIFGRPAPEKWSVGDVVADPPRRFDFKHPLQSDDACRSDICEGNETDLLAEILVAFPECQITKKLALCNVLNAFNPVVSRDKLVEILGSGHISSDLMLEYLTLLRTALDLGGLPDDEQQDRLVDLLRQHINFGGVQSLSLEVVLRTKRPSTFEFARTLTNHHVHGIVVGDYLARNGDPAGWPHVRELLDVGLDNLNEYGWTDALAGLRGLAGSEDENIRTEMTRVTLSEFDKELSKYSPSNRRVLVFLYVLAEARSPKIEALLLRTLSSNLNDELKKAAAAGLKGEDMAKYLPEHAHWTWW